MKSLIPQPKQMVTAGQKGLHTGDGVQLELYADHIDPRLETHCRRAFPGARLTVSPAERGFTLVIRPQSSDRSAAEPEGGESAVAVAAEPDAASAPPAAADAASWAGLDGRAEGYRLEVTADHAVLCALDAPGLYYGLQTLLQLRSPEGEIPAVSVTDWPDTQLRAMNFDLRQTFSKPERLIQYIADFSRYKINALLIEYEDKFPFRRHPEVVHPRHALREAQLEALRQTAHEHFIEIIPLQQSFGHLEYVLRHSQWRHLRETEQSTGELCPSNPASFVLVTELLEEMMDAHPDSRYIHLGCDEVYSLCECPQCKDQFGGVRERAFIAFLNRLIAFAASRGKTPIFWHDMLDQCPPDELAQLDPRSAAMIWIYNGRNIGAEVSALTAKFRAHGIEVMGAPAVRSFDWAEHQNYPVLPNRTDNLLQWAETADKLDIGCMVATNWTGPFSLGVPYGIFETTWYPMLLHADLAWNRTADTESFIDRFLEQFHGVDPAACHAKLGNYRLEDYYEIIWKLLDEVRDNKDYAELISIMHDYEVATDRSRAIHKYVYRWELYPGDEAEWTSLVNNYRRNRSGRDNVRPRMQAALERYQASDMAEHYVKSRMYLHDYLERTLYAELGLGRTD